MDGRIKTINRERGFLFITDEAGRDYFAHRSDLADGAKVFSDLNEDDQVTFEPVVPTPVKGPRAAKVRAIEASTPAA